MKKTEQIKGLPRPFFVLAPMDDVTDTVFRQIIAETAAPDLFFTEFVNVDGLQSPGREKLLPKLKLGPHEGMSRLSHVSRAQGGNEKRTNRIDDTESQHRKQTTQRSAASYVSEVDSVNLQVKTVRKAVPIIAQIWGKNPENYYKTTKDIIAMGYDGVDINMGCPDKAVVKNGCCSALINDRELAGEIIKAVQDAARDHFPVSVKTRVGFTTIDLSWIEFLLSQKLNMLTIHARTKKEMSKVPAHWELFADAVSLRNAISPSTLIVGNGDITTRKLGEELAEKYKLDGVMIGRGIFHDPYVFAVASPWHTTTKEEKIALYKKHVQLFADTWQNNERRLPTLNKFCKVYIQGFDGAKELREKLMNAKTSEELLKYLAS
jgi:tRNA-dihydrouridine synthase